MTPRFKPMDFAYYPKTRLLILKVDYGTLDITRDVLCYHAWNFTKQKLCVYAVKAVDQKASSCPNVASCTSFKEAT